MMMRCSVSSLSLSGLSISSEDSSATQVTTASGGSTITRSSLKRGLGSAACSNLRALAVQMEEASPDTSMDMQVDTTSDDWGYFVDATPPNNTYGSVHISWWKDSNLFHTWRPFFSRQLHFYFWYYFTRVHIQHLVVWGTYQNTSSQQQDHYYTTCTRNNEIVMHKRALVPFPSFVWEFY